MDLPIYLYATCYGVQHISMILRDQASAERVYLTKQKITDTPRDIYSEYIPFFENILRPSGVYGTEDPEYQNFINIMG